MLRHAVLKCGVSVRWFNGLDLYADYRDRMKGREFGERAFVAKLVEPDVLAISDPLPPVGAITEFQSQLLFRIIDSRIRNNKSVWLTLNISTSDEAEKRLGVSVVDRLRQDAVSLFCNWKATGGVSNEDDTGTSDFDY